ncbi:calmodulin-like 3, partial [Nowakowskiella sp. JEL0407]
MAPTPEQITEYRDAFALFDSDADQLLNYSEIATVVRALGGNPTEAQILSLAKNVDKEKKGLLSFADFLEIIPNCISDADQSSEIKEAFRIFDKTDSGVISASELKHVLTSIGEKLTTEQVNDLLAELDPKGTGNIEFAAFN